MSVGVVRCTTVRRYGRDYQHIRLEVTIGTWEAECLICGMTVENATMRRHAFTWLTAHIWKEHPYPKSAPFSAQEKPSSTQPDV